MELTAKDTRGDTSNYNWLPMMMMFIAVFDQIWLMAIGFIIALVLHGLTDTSNLHNYAEVEEPDDVEVIE